MPLFIGLDCFGKASELEDQPGGNQVNVGFTCATIKGRTPRFKVGSHSMRSLTDWVKLYCASSPRDQTTSVSSALPLVPATTALTIDIANFHGNVFIHFQTTVCFPAD